jgi:predicted RNA-binding protein with PUA-like domain
MAYWLVKSEPDSWSWDEQVKIGAKGTAWTGVRNFTAKANLEKMKKGERAFFYHSNEGKEIVGICEVAKAAHPDSTDDSGQWECVDIRAVTEVPKPVSLAVVKKTPKLAKMSLVTSARLSVQPVTDAEWKLICEMGGVKA